jgi:hypothetical protein
MNTETADHARTRSKRPRSNGRVRFAKCSLSRICAMATQSRGRVEAYCFAECSTALKITLGAVDVASFVFVYTLVRVVKGLAN